MKRKGAERVERMATERDSFARAVNFFLRNEQKEEAIEMATNVWRLWVLARDYEGGRKFLAPVIAKHDGAAAKTLALVHYGDSLLAFRLGDVPASRKASMAALVAAKSARDSKALTLANLALARTAFEDGDYRQSSSRSREARRLARGIGPEYEQAPLFMEASSRRMLGDYDGAASLFRRSVELNRRIEDSGMVMAELNNLCFVEIHRDRADEAEAAFAESERMSPTPPDDLYGQGMASLIRGMVAYRRGEIKRAKSLLTRARTNFKRSGAQLGKEEESELDWLTQALKRQPSGPHSSRGAVMGAKGR